MPYAMNEQQFNVVVALTGEQRLSHFVSKVADWELLWGMANDEGWLVPQAPEGFEYFPVWPHPDYAKKTTDLVFPGHQPEEIDLDHFMDHWLSKLEKDGVKVAVFPNMNWDFWVIEPKDLTSLLREEAAQYE